MGAPRRRSITPKQRELLHALADGQPHHIDELAAGARSRASTTGALRTLERLEQVTSETLGDGWYADRTYTITAKGREAIA